MENNPDRFSVIARSRKQVARPHASRARCDPPISARRSPSSRHLAPINAHTNLTPLLVICFLIACRAHTSRNSVGNQSGGFDVRDHQKLLSDALELLREKNAALRHSNAYPTAENKCRMRTLQCRVMVRMMKVKNKEWSNVMKEITPTHKGFWKATKALKSKGYLPTPSLKKPDNFLALLR
ncbi:hypothetical protein EVAR_63893_1 [Eumeta japonica]|uniref:Uncharacterized protein n=1 Tax=Eumeta variegata TaxID=151549 RepID=A0A4C1ZJ46_EUMVA|nr:hypothetical protein EVAR_63893_1 [Eumeta japonica]